jgi:hypothetical protein
MAGANSGGRVADGTSYIKQFVYGVPNTLWKATPYFSGGGTSSINVITPALEDYPNVLIPGDLYVNGIIIPSDKYLKENIEEINNTTTNKIMNLKASQFTLKKDETSRLHYGFIAQEMEKNYPELISVKPDTDVANLRSINYLEIIPLLVSKVQMMQKEIDELKEHLRHHK